MADIDFGQAELRRARRSGKILLIAVFVFSIFANLLMLTGPLFMLQIYDRVLGSRSEATLVALFLLVAALYAIFGLLDFVRGRLLARAGARFQMQLDRRVFQASIKLAAGPTRQNSGGLRDLETIQSLLSSTAFVGFCDVPWTPIFILAIFVFHPLMGWFALASGVLLIILTLANNYLTRRDLAAAQSDGDAAQILAYEAQVDAQIIKSQGMETAMMTRWLEMRKTALEGSARAADRMGGFASFTKAFRMFMQSSMLALGAYLTLQNQMTGGAMIAGSILLGRALAPIEQTLSQWPQFSRAITAWRDLGDLLEKVHPDPEMPRLPQPTAHLSVANLAVMAPVSNKAILNGVGFDLAPGEALGIIGKSGSGKSSLAKCLLRLTNPTAGEVRLGGARLDQYSTEDLGKYIGYLPQEVSLFSGSVARNIARMEEVPDIHQVIRAAKQANAHELILDLPDGYKTQMNSKDSQLSGGQRQRVALARALYGDPVLLVLDEPNSALDGEGSEALNRTISEFKKSDRTVVIMTHRPMAISECDRLIVLEAGLMRADGSRDEVLENMMRNASQISQSIRPHEKAS